MRSKNTRIDWATETKTVVRAKFSLLAALIVTVCGSFATVSNEALPGGKATIVIQGSGKNAFSQPSANMSVTRKLDFSVGNSFFRSPWVSAPASTTARDGLGPLFNINSCQGCHIKDGRGHAPEGPNDNAVSMLVRLSLPAETAQEKEIIKTRGVMPVPVYASQLQDASIPGVPAEGRIKLTWRYLDVQFADANIITLRRPQVRIVDL